MIDREEVLRIAALAKLELNEGEIEQYQKDLTNFLVSGRKLQKVQMEEIERASHAVAITPDLRRDEVGESLTQEAVLNQGPEIMGGFFKVPRIVEEQQ